MKLTATCQICDRPLLLKAETPMPTLGGFYREYKCGHSFFDPTPALPPSLTQTYNFKALLSDKQAFDFQRDGVQFIVESGFNCLIADPMGLGKTIQILLAAREAKLSDGTPRFKTILAVVKAATTYQWLSETKEWYSPELWSAFIIQGTKSFIPPGFRLYIISMDTMSRLMKTPAGLATLKSLGIDLVIVDECHSFKNPDSARSQALVAFLQDVSKAETEREITLVCNICRKAKQGEAPSYGESQAFELAKLSEPEWDGTWTETAHIKYDVRTNRQGTLSYRHASQCPRCKSRVVVYQDRIILDERERSKGLVMLSGTPIKNRAEEYFVPLNLLRPDIFTNLASFRRNWLVQDPDTGKWNRIAPWRLEAFRELTKDFILRREKNQVLSLPPFRRNFQHIEIEDSKFKEAYNKALDGLQKRVDELAAQGKEMTFFEVQDNLMTLRRIIGMAKMPFAIEYTEEFLESVEGEKLAIGIHHESVRDNLFFALKAKGIKVLKLSGEDSAERKNDILKQFNKDPEIRVIIINMIAGGVGLNIQAANNVLTLERQWNAADEEQFEGRFWRQGQTLPVNDDYMVAAGIPVEDYFTEMVEQKRKISGETLDGWNFTQDAGAVREIVYKSLSTKLR
jgi:SNF2 family DNA or RNA helicase